MLTMQVAEVEALKNNLLPLLHISHHADFRFSRSTTSFTVGGSHSSSWIFVQLQIYEPFFTLLSSNNLQDFHSCIHIDNFFLATFITGANDRLLTVFMPDDHSFTNLIFTNGIGHLQYCTALEMGPPLNIKVAQMDNGVFVAIDVEWFRDIATRLSAFNTRIWVTATDSELKFSAELLDIMVPVEGKRCWIGELGAGVRFQVTLIPLQFFIQASQLDKMVYFYRSIEGSTLVTFKTNWTNIVASNPQDQWEALELDSIKRSE